MVVHNSVVVNEVLSAVLFKEQEPMDGEQLEQLIRQPEGLKLEFKQRFYEIDSSDRDIRKQQRGELCKDILSLANGNVNVAHLTGYLVIGVGDALKANAHGICTT
jgi:predicted HTH transcriptional regulator